MNGNGRPVLHASLTQGMVNRLVQATADAWYITFDDARYLLEHRWAEEARQRIANNLSTYLMWEEMVEMARKAVPPAQERSA